MIAVDTSALFAFLVGEPDAEAMITAMQGNDVAVAAPTWSESSIVVHWKLGPDGTLRLRHLAQSLEFEIVSFDHALAEAAIAAHMRFGRGSGHPAKLNMGDCFAYALAKSRDLPLLFKGDDFTHTDIVPVIRMG